MKRLDAVVAREVDRNGEKKTYWTKIGAAFERDKGGYSIQLDANPIDGKFFLFPPSDKAGGGGGQQRAQAPDSDDEPF